jgi:hypothetical protein
MFKLKSEIPVNIKYYISKVIGSKKSLKSVEKQKKYV